ncbi:PREDICTED: protein YLS9-like [Nelumbo nucifera]|uniref:Protein YLS9-like n=2 Tax=Nelumbo nucifera TaxID=4432 RepID=A0A1U8A6T1_NELNU|nr:PREDICTED: protein YLS9-like [Nelumbo nucifera]DAD28923.1 TPA_asm: hypothetical protein HUJ06_030391 [Nelumbo nucifera]
MAVLGPAKLKYRVVNASLIEFNLTTDNIVRYNLALNMAFRNPDKKHSVYYERISVDAYYRGKKLGGVSMDPFYQGKKNTSMLNPVFQGQSWALRDSSKLEDFRREKSAGVFELQLKFPLKIMRKLGSLKFGPITPEVICKLRLPLASNRSFAGAFETTTCKEMNDDIY